MEANTFDKPVNPSASPGSFSDPIPVESDVYHTVASDQTSTFSPSPSAPPPRPPPRESALEQFYSQDQYSTPSPTPAPGPSLGPAQSPSTLPRKRNTADDDNSPCIARLSIPQSHMSLFHDALTSPPDPDLKIRKKTVRFNKSSLTSSPPRSEQRNERSRESESPGPYSTSTKSPSHSSSSSSKSVAVKSGHSGSSGTMKSNVVHVVEKDPEERMAELMELKQMKIRQDDLLHLKDQVFQTGQNLEEKQSILDEVRAERKALHSELNRYITMVKQVQKDLELAIQAETQLTKERDQLSQYLNQIRDYDFKVLKEEVDQLRSKKGLRPLPSLEQEQEEFMGRYLEERRGQWREDGGGGGGSHQDPSGQPLSSSSSSAFNSSTSATAATTASSSSDTPSRGHYGSSSRTNSSGPTASSSSSSLRGRDNNTDSRLNRTSGSHSNHSRNNSSASAGRHSSRGTTSQSSSSRSRRQSRSRSRSPAPSLSSREERSKKRSRH
ncbi:hypothetical protein BGX29_006412 [Mortierella sp. GBA35]|nr:hypothetical protein BGX29_006412 [Mortierella sp. GBA35]